MNEITYRVSVLKNCPAFDRMTTHRKLGIAGLGTAGEAGEVADLIKKILYHDVPLESVRDKLIKEMGDVYWYLDLLGATLGISTGEVLSKNVEKLKKRHPKGWTPQSQQQKLDEQ